MSYKIISPKEAYEKMQEGFAYLDVRTPEEFAKGHAKGAVNIPLFTGSMEGERQFNMNFVEEVKKQFPADVKLIVGCHSGGRSSMACELLSKHNGSQTLCNIDGGFGGNLHQKGWKAEGLPTE